MVDLLSDTLDDKLEEMVQDELDDSLPDVALSETLRKVVEPVRQPSELADGIWLSPGIEGIAVSQLVGGNAQGQPSFDIVAALNARPTVGYGAQPVAAPLPPLPVTVGAAGDSFHLEPTGSIALGDASAMLDKALGDFLAAQPRKYAKIKHSVELYQSGNKLVVMLKLQKPGFLGGSGTVYLHGTPSFDAQAKLISLDDLKFDLESRNIVLKLLAGTFDRQIEDYLQQQAHFPVDAQLAQTLDQIGDFRIESPSGTFSGKVKEVALGQIWVSDGKLNFTVTADGSSRFDARLPDRAGGGD